MTFSQEREAFESAVSRLPYAVFVVDSDNRLRAMNRQAERLWSQESFHELQIRATPNHQLSKVVAKIRGGTAEDDEVLVLQLGDERFEVIHSTPSPKGDRRWLMLMLRPFPNVISVDLEALRRRWSLTRREAEVAAACIAGRSTAEICEALSISRETVKTHVARLLHKSDCQSRTQLIAKYLFGE